MVGFVMGELNRRIVTDGQVFPGDVLKVDSFLNHQIDPEIMHEITGKWLEYFKDREITKILTIEASGIAPAIIVASTLGVPMLFAKKATPSTLTNHDLYTTPVHSYTKNVTNEILVSKKYLSPDDKVLIVDDFLANGEAALGLADLVEQSGAEVVGIGICIEKSYQPGRQKLDDAGYEVYSVSRIQSLANGRVEFLSE